jgi:L-threonylcarbamoyladenylate synthase
MAKTTSTTERARLSGEDDIRRAAEILRRGGLVAFPTETVYGLGADARNPGAVRRIYAAKGRPANSPLIVHAANLEEARALVSEWPARADELARRHWPGPLTLVLPKSRAVPDEVTAGLPTVGIRVPDHPVALALLRAAQLPIAAPSANRFMGLSPTEAAHVDPALADLVLDGGPSPVGIESTVVSLAGGVERLLRPGHIRIAGIAAASVPDTEAHPAPGMHDRHYSPRTPFYLGSGPRHGHGYRWTLPGSPLVCAAKLYATLHTLDRQGYDWIAVELPPDEPEWAAIRDRLRRAAGHGGEAA